MPTSFLVILLEFLLLLGCCEMLGRDVKLSVLFLFDGINSGLVIFILKVNEWIVTTASLRPLSYMKSRGCRLKQNNNIINHDDDDDDDDEYNNNNRNDNDTNTNTNTNSKNKY